MLSAGAVDRWAEDWADTLNPILVKETRQAFKARMVTLSFLAALLLAWCVAFSAVWEPSHPDAILGPPLLARLLIVLSLALFYVVPYVSFRSMAAERDTHTFEMLHTSALSDQQIFWGKLSSALILIGLFEAAFAPFISMTYMLRGLSVIDIVAALVLISAMAITLSLFGLMLGAATSQLHWQVFNMFLLLGGATIAASILAEATWSTRGFNNPLGMICFLIFFTGLPSLFFAAVTLSNLRPPTMGLVRTYVGYEDLAPIAAAAGELESVIEENVPVEYRSPVILVKKAFVSRTAAKNVLQAAVQLERLLNPRRRFFGHLGRYRYLTVKGAAEPLEKICSMQNRLLFQFRFLDACLLEVDQIPIEEKTAIYPLNADQLREFKEAVARMGTLVASEMPVETEEAGIFASRPDSKPEDETVPSRQS